MVEVARPRRLKPDFLHSILSYPPKSGRAGMLALHDQHKERPILRALCGGWEFEISWALFALDFPRSTAVVLPQRLKPYLLGAWWHD